MNENVLTRAASFEPSSFNTERGTVEAIISAGADVVRRDYQGEYKERLNMNAAAWTVARGAVPVLKDHQRTVDSVIGRAENVRIDGGRALATVPTLPASAAILKPGFSIPFRLASPSRSGESSPRAERAFVRPNRL